MSITAIMDAAGSERALTQHFTVSVENGFASALDLWAEMAQDGGALPFQQRAWLDPWAATKGRRYDLLAVTVRDAAGVPVVGLPLVRQRGRITRIGFADGGLADYNGPILSSRAPQDEAGAKALWHATLQALPRSDVIRLERMPKRIGARVNPFALLDGVRPVAKGGLSLDMPGSFEEWMREKPRRYRMELGRCSRLFDAEQGSRFERVSGDVERVFGALEVLQSRRIGKLGHRYVLDETDEADFYRALVTGGGRNGVLTALRIGDDVVATMYGIRNNDWFVMLRIGAAEQWSQISPARLLIVRTMELLRAEGVRTFDFGLGDYPYKRKLGAEPVALCDLVAARSPLGLVELGKFRLSAAVHENPRLLAAAKSARERLQGLRARP